MNIPKGTQTQPNTTVGKNYNIYFLLKLLREHFDIINLIINSKFSLSNI